MIRAQYTEGSDGYELLIDGHAGYAEHGKDIVCAACSGITYALLALLEEYSDEVTDVAGPVVDSGCFYVSCKGTERIQTAFHMAVLGLRKISSQYPAHVMVLYSGNAGDSREQTARKEHGEHA